MIKFEIVITAWQDGIHKGRRRIESDDHIQATNMTQSAMEDILDKIEEEKAKWKKIVEDDDIPF